MSSKLVKRLLRLSSEEPVVEPERPAKKRRRHNNNPAKPVTNDELVASRVRQMLALDKTISVKAKVSKQELSKKLRQHDEQKSIQKMANRTIVTNARSSALLSTRKMEKTVNDKAHKKAKEEKTLLSIAQKLKAIKKK